MSVYLDIVRFGFLRFFSYPFEIIASVLKRAFEILFLIIFWSIYIKSAGISVSLSQITGYFLIAIGIADLSMARWGQLSSLIGNQIKHGGISNYIIKPSGLIPTLYALSLGRNGMRLILAVINIIIALLLLPQNSPLSYLYFLLFFLNSWAISFAYNILEGTLFFHFSDASGIRNSLENFVRILTGTMIPLYLFPEPLRNILRYTPFPSMVYLPANAISNSVSKGFALDFTIGLAWAIILNLAALSWWRHSLKKYEAVGI